jgi:hypothetical protein
MLTAIAAEAAGPLTVELVLLKWNCEAWLMTAHLPRRKVARAFLAKVLEIARADTAAVPMDNRPPAAIARAHRVRRQALAIIEEYAPRYAARLPEEAI